MSTCRCVKVSERLAVKHKRRNSCVTLRYLGLVLGLLFSAAQTLVNNSLVARLLVSTKSEVALTCRPYADEEKAGLAARQPVDLRMNRKVASELQMNCKIRAGPFYKPRLFQRRRRAHSVGIRRNFMMAVARFTGFSSRACCVGSRRIKGGRSGAVLSQRR